MLPASTRVEFIMTAAMVVQLTDAVGGKIACGLCYAP